MRKINFQDDKVWNQLNEHISQKLTGKNDSNFNINLADNITVDDAKTSLTALEARHTENENLSGTVNNPADVASNDNATATSITYESYWDTAKSMIRLSNKIKLRTDDHKHKDNDDDEDAETLFRLLRENEKHIIRNPYVLIITIQNYSASRIRNSNRKQSNADHRVGWKDLIGPGKDAIILKGLWSDIYNFSDVAVWCDDSSNTKISAPTKTFVANANNFTQGIISVRDELHANLRNDGLIVCYAGHGVKDAIILANGDKFELASLFELFDGNKCPYLRNKPKIFILDSCRGQETAETLDTSRHRGKVTEQRDDWIDVKFHPSSGFATIFGNCESYVVQDSFHGGYLMKSIVKIFENPPMIKNYSLRELIIAIRRQTKIYAGIGDSKRNIGTAQCVDFHESLEYSVYFAKSSKKRKVLEDVKATENTSKQTECIVQ